MSPGGRVTPGREHGHAKWWKQADIPESEGGSCTDRRGAYSHSRTFRASGFPGGDLKVDGFLVTVTGSVRKRLS